MRTILSVVALALLPLGIAGCVSKGEYTKKAQTADRLDQELTGLQIRYEALQRENASLKNELGTAGKENDRLASDRADLERALKAKSDQLGKNVVELRQRVQSLEEDNARLTREIADSQKSREEKVRELSSTYDQLVDKMKSEIEKGQVTISELKGKLTVNLVEAILFDSGRADVKPGGLVVLGKVIEILKTVTDKNIRIEGHTDNVQISGSLAQRYPTNWELSAARAINVARYLQKQAINPATLSAIAFGEFRPVADNGTPEGREKNRRIEIVLVPKD
ncbi:MAG TPA: OmpA family protein [Methylomirabilota bacterium]